MVILKACTTMLNTDSLATQITRCLFFIVLVLGVPIEIYYKVVFYCANEMFLTLIVDDSHAQHL